MSFNYSHPHLGPQPKMLAVYSLRPRSTGPWERQSRGLSDLAETEKAAQLPGLAEALSLQPPPLSRGLAYSLPLNLRNTVGRSSLAIAGFLGKMARKASWVRGCCRRLLILSLEPFSQHTHLVGEGEGEPGTHVYPAPLHHTPGHI